MILVVWYLLLVVRWFDIGSLTLGAIVSENDFTVSSAGAGWDGYDRLGL